MRVSRGVCLECAKSAWPPCADVGQDGHDRRFRPTSPRLPWLRALACHGSSGWRRGRRGLDSRLAARQKTVAPAVGWDRARMQYIPESAAKRGCFIGFSPLGANLFSGAPRVQIMHWNGDPRMDGGFVSS